MIGAVVGGILLGVEDDALRHLLPAIELRNPDLVLVVAEHAGLGRGAVVVVAAASLPVGALPGRVVAVALRVADNVADGESHQEDEDEEREYVEERLAQFPHGLLSHGP